MDIGTEAVYLVNWGSSGCAGSAESFQAYFGALNSLIFLLAIQLLLF